MSNRRQFSRIEFHTEARLTLPTGEVGAEVVDLSLKGALIRLLKDVHLSPGTPATLRIRLDELGPMIRMDGDVRHHESGYLGFCCRQIDLESVTHLRRLVELNLGNADLLERELTALTGK